MLRRPPTRRRLAKSGCFMKAALEGELGHFHASEVLQLLQLAEATGRLTLERAGERAELYFENGRPVFARTSGTSVRTGEILVYRGAISRESLEHALEEQRLEPAERLGALLVRKGQASADQVAQAVHEASRRIIYGLTLWHAGRFSFMAGERLERDELRLDLELDRLILEGLRQADQAREKV